MADRVCTNTWAEKGVELVVKQRTAADIVKFVQDNEITMVCNFDPYAAEMGLPDALKGLGIQFFGTDASFARTELDRVFFKELLIKSGIKTPEILCRGSEQDILNAKFNFVYPFVIKPSLSLVSPVVIYNYEELEAHFRKVRKRVERTGKKVDWLVERYIDAVDTLSVNYIVGAGEYKVRTTYRVDFVPKSDDNLVGVTTLVQPHPKEAEYINIVNEITSLLAGEGHCGFGFFQALMDKSGELYVIENNARPISCGVFDGVESDVMPLINAALEGGLSSVTAGDTYESSLVSADGNKAFYSEGAILQHKSRAVFYEEEKIKNISAILAPFSMRKVEGGYLSEKILPPSIVAAVGGCPEEVKRVVAEAVEKLASA
jgi:phosphoribosylamine-glycine ligase